MILRTLHSGVVRVIGRNIGYVGTDPIALLGGLAGSYNGESCPPVQSLRGSCLVPSNDRVWHRVPSNTLFFQDRLS